MKLLHTADWHVGQLFHEYDRTYEHQQFLDWILGTLAREQIDVLLISGDVFDISNPSAASVKMLYKFLNQAVRACPDLQIIVTAGNHDSAARLESPKPLLESSKIHMVGLVEKDKTGSIDYSKITIPILDQDGNIVYWCIAAPFLRIGDYLRYLMATIRVQKVWMHFIQRHSSMLYRTGNLARPSLQDLVHRVVASVKKNLQLDWTKKEDAKAAIRLAVKKELIEVVEWSFRIWTRTWLRSSSRRRGNMASGRYGILPIPMAVGIYYQN